MDIAFSDYDERDSDQRNTNSFRIALAAGIIGDFYCESGHRPELLAAFKQLGKLSESRLLDDPRFNADSRANVLELRFSLNCPVHD